MKCHIDHNTTANISPTRFRKKKNNLDELGNNDLDIKSQVLKQPTSVLEDDISTKRGKDYQRNKIRVQI